ncbi:MAG: hypothetical protein V1750_01005 [Acidobacteriota bacterium]
MRITQEFLPQNQWLERELDRRWRAWLTRCLAGATVVGISLAAIVRPDQAVMRARYEMAQLTREVEQLEREHRRLVLEREALTSPIALAGEVEALGLVPVPREQVAHLTPAGRLVFAKAVAPALRRSEQPRLEAR